MEGSTRLKMDGTDIRSKSGRIIIKRPLHRSRRLSGQVRKNGNRFDGKEFDLLYLFARNRGKVVKRSEVLQVISTPGMSDEDGAINIMICRLRKKLEANPHRPRRLVSVRGLGYKLKEQIT